MDATVQYRARVLLPAREACYKDALASLAYPGLSTAQRHTRQGNATRALRALNYVRVAAGPEELAGPPLLSLDGLLEQQRESLSHLQAA